MQRREAELGSFAVNARPETARLREFGRHVFEIAALSRASLKRDNLRVWVVELEGTELTTPLPVVEPVSDLRVRNGIFRCRDGRVKTEFSSRGDRYGDAGGREKPASRETMRGYRAEFETYGLDGKRIRTRT